MCDTSCNTELYICGTDGNTKTDVTLAGGNTEMYVTLVVIQRRMTLVAILRRV